MTIKKEVATSSNISQNENKILKTVQEGYNLTEDYFAVEMKKASIKKDGPMVLNLVQLTDERYKDFYVDTDKVRYGHSISPLEQGLKNPLSPYTKRLFSGIKGSGKTMELIKLCFRLQDDFNVIIFSAFNRFKFVDITIEPLLFEIVGDLLEYIYSNGLVNESNELLRCIIENITRWCSETEIIENKSRTHGQSLEAEITFLKGIFFTAKTERKFYSKEKIDLPVIEDRKINELIVECNKIFDYLKKKTGKYTLIIIDDLEKMSFAKIRELFGKHFSFIRDLHCKMVLTIPMELIFHSDFSIIRNTFGEPEILPVIMIKDKNGKEYLPGLNILVEIVKRRLDFSIFDKECYLTAVKYSGGLISDLFLIIQRAALNEESEIITEKAMQKSINYQQDVFASRIQERNDELKIKYGEYLAVLLDIYNGNKTTPEKNLAFLDLIENRLVIKYENYYDIHPLLDDFLQNYKKTRKEEKHLPSLVPIEEINNGYLKEIEIQNFFCIENISLDNLQDKKEVYIVGENGDGKTIFLQAILLAFKGDRNVGEIINFIKQNPRTNYYLKAVDDQNSTYIFSEMEPNRKYIAKNVVAYGVHRSRNDSDKADEYGYLTLFQEDSYLKSPVKWLQYLHHKEKAEEQPPIDLKTAINMLKSLLDNNVEMEVTPDTVTFVERNTRVEFSQLADGYKSVITWVCDLLEKLSKKQPGVQNTQDFKGIVILDEIELFLHPKWKNKIVRKLRHWFPGIQFIFTSHSATVILGASKDAVFYRLYKEAGITNVSQPVLKISNLMLNDLITSPLFGLESAHAVSFEDDVPEELESTVFQNNILAKLNKEEDKKFIQEIYRKSPAQQTGSSARYILKDNLNSAELDRLISILISVGYKERLHTDIDFLYLLIHREVENRIKKMGCSTEDDITNLVHEELDKYEKNYKS